MKKLIGALALSLTAALLCVPVQAASVVISDAFSKSAAKPWETDMKDPAKWDTSENYLSITVNNRATVRSAASAASAASANKGGVYDVQGKKLALDKPASSAWTASVKLNADSSWYSSATSRRTAIFRLDLVDETGSPLDTAAAIALEKRGSLPQWACLNPELAAGWSYPKLYTGTSAGLLRKELEVEEGWRTLYIKCDQGYITYQVDGKVIGGFDLGVSQAYPTYAALGLADLSGNYTVDFDSFYLYNGNVGAVKKILTEEEEEDRESSQEERHRERRARWIANHTEYLFYDSDGDENWVRGGQLTDEEKAQAYNTRRVGDEPSWFDDY